MKNRKENDIGSQGSKSIFQADWSKAPEQLKELIGNLPAFQADWSKALEQLKELYGDLPNIDIDLEEKRQVYDVIAGFLHDIFQKTEKVSLEATYILCKETGFRLLPDDVLIEEGTKDSSASRQDSEGISEIGMEASTERQQSINDGVVDPNGGKADNETQELVTDAKEIILAIKVVYEPGQNRSYNRQIEIFWLKNNEPTMLTVQKELPWDCLPTDVRAKHLNSGADTLIFKIYQTEV